MWGHFGTVGVNRIDIHPPINWTRLAAWNVKEALTFERASMTRALFLEGALNIIERHSRTVAVRDEARELLALVRKRRALSRIRVPTECPLPDRLKFSTDVWEYVIKTAIG